MSKAPGSKHTAATKPAPPSADKAQVRPLGEDWEPAAITTETGEDLDDALRRKDDALRRLDGEATDLRGKVRDLETDLKQAREDLRRRDDEMTDLSMQLHDVIAENFRIRHARQTTHGRAVATTSTAYTALARELLARGQDPGVLLDALTVLYGPKKPGHDPRDAAKRILTKTKE